MRPLSSAIIALGFSPVNGAPYEGLVFAIPLAPSGAKRHFVCEEAYMADGGRRQTGFDVDIRIVFMARPRPLVEGFA